MAQNNRIIVSVDLDCFYAQCAQRADPSLWNQTIPIGVLQRSFVATTNHVARRIGAPKCGSRSTVVKACPTIKLIQQDMALYRRESSRIHEKISLFFSQLFLSARKIAIEKSGIDEFLIDLSPMLSDEQQRLSVLLENEQLYGHFLFVAPSDWLFVDNGGGGGGGAQTALPRVASEHDASLLLASKIGNRLRKRLLDDLGYTVTVGVATNKSLAKMAGSSHKPDTLSVVSSSRAQDFLSNICLRKIAG
jgi:nucleotidyltransferase/DNA polymerase involved in DNA repair